MINPYPQGKWLNLQLTQEKTNSIDDGETEEDGTQPDNILRGPLWNYGNRNREKFFSELLFGKTRKTRFFEDEFIVKGTQWSPPKPSKYSFAEHLFRRMKKIKPDETALLEVDTGRSLNYGEVIHKSQSLASGLRWIGILPGQVISLVSYNSIECQLMVLASFLVGAIAAPVDSSLNAMDLGSMLRIASPRLIFSETGRTLSKVETALGYLMMPRLPNVVVNDYKMSLHYKQANHFTFNQLLKEVEPGFRPVYRHLNLTNPLLILYTSGTMGSAKGALISEQFYMSSRLYQESVITLPGPAYTTLLSSPLFWINSISISLIHLSGGHRIVFFRGPVSEALLISALHKYEVAMFVTGPAMLMYLLYWPAKPHYPKLKFVITTGMPFTLRNIIRVRDEVFDGKVFISQIYGMTETGMLTSNTPYINKYGSVGRPFFNVQMKVLDINSGLPLGPNEEGELCFKSPSMMLGYYNNIEATEAVFDEDGFLHTGDCGYYDDLDFVFITGRLKDMIKWRSYQITPAEVEMQLVIQDPVKEAVVFGLFHEKDGEVVTAAVILKPGYEGYDPQLIEKVANYNLSSSRRIRGGVHILKNFPLTATGKPMRKAIAKQVLDQTMNVNITNECTH